MRLDTNKQITVKLKAFEWVALYNFIDSLEAGQSVEADRLNEIKDILFQINGQLFTQIISV